MALSDFEEKIIFAVLRLAVSIEEGSRKIANSLEKIEDGNCCSSEDLNELLDKGFDRISTRLHAANELNERMADIQLNAYNLAAERYRY